MFWDGYRWVPDAPEKQGGTPRVSRHARLKDTLSTFVVLLLLPALTIPFLSVAGVEPTLKVDGTAVPGGSVDVTGSGFPPRVRLGLSLDGSSSGMPSPRTSAQGAFATRLVIPTSLNPGEHTIGAFAKDSGASRKADRRGSAPVQVIATVNFTVVDPADLPSLSPTESIPPPVVPTTAPEPTTTFTEPSAPPPTPQPTPDPTRPAATPEPTPDPTPRPTATPQPTPTSPPFDGGATGPYGSCQGDSRNNHHVGGWARADLDYRFRATTSSAAESLRVQQRGGVGYSGGNGGQITASIQTDDGGLPSGNVLASLTFSPGNPSGHWEVWDYLVFPSPANLTDGRIYHLVFTNVAADPVNNFISLNDMVYWGSESPRQPMFENTFAVLYKETSGWQLKGNDAPIFDLGYANGVHDGMAYIGSMHEYYGVISGASNMVRQHFTVSGSDRAVSSASVKVKRISGSDPLTISLRKGSTTLVSETVAASAIALGELPIVLDGAHLGGNTWATISFADLTLESGATYNLVLSTGGGTQYIAVPVQEGTDKGLRSYRFTDGLGQGTTNGGSSWSQLYLWSDVDLQFVLD